MSIPVLEVKLDAAQMKEIEAIFANMPKKITRVLYRAINRVLRRMRTRIVRLTAKELRIRQKLIRERVWIQKANSKKLRGRVRAGAYGWPYILFSALQKLTGVQVKIGKKQLLEHAFMARMPTGHLGVFRRGTKATFFPGAPRLPIHEQRTYSPTKIIRKLGAEPWIIADAAALLTKRITAETELILSGKRK